MGIDGQPDRIKLEMTTIEVIMAMSEGNPGAVRVLTECLKRGAEIDPQNAFGALGSLLTLDSYRFYASKIWMLYKDLCGMDISKTIGLLRAMQLGIVDSDLVHRAIGDDQTMGQPEVLTPYGGVEGLLVKVKERLPQIQIVPTE